MATSEVRPGQAPQDFPVRSVIIPRAEARMPAVLDALTVVRLMNSQSLDPMDVISASGIPIDLLDAKRFVEPLASLNKENPLDPANFAKSKAGKVAKEALEFYKTCKALGDEPCQNDAVLILNFDVMADLEHQALCLSHLEPAMESINDALSGRGRVSFGINGHGRA